MDKGVRKDEKREGAKKERGRMEGGQAGETGRGMEGKTQRKLEEKM